MKLFLTLNFVLFYCLSFGQSPEQIALDFYASNILNKSTISYPGKIKLRYDKHINPIDSQYQKLAKFIVSEYNNCKIDPRGANNREIKRTFVEWEQIRQQIDTITFNIPKPTNAQSLVIPKKIKHKKKLKYKELKDGFIRFHTEQIWNCLFKEKHNLTIEPYCIFGEHQYVWLKASKNDLEYGAYYFIEIRNNKVTDWCQVNWIQ